MRPASASLLSFASWRATARIALLMREDARSVYPLQVHCGLIWGGPAERRLLAEIWSDAAPQPFHAAPAYALSPEWEFLYLAVHAARHGLFPFKWLVDLDWLLVRGALDWKKVQEKARRLGWERAVQSCLAACAALLETPVPEPFAERCLPRRRESALPAPGLSKSPGKHSSPCGCYPPSPKGFNFSPFGYLSPRRRIASSFAFPPRCSFSITSCGPGA